MAYVDVRSWSAEHVVGWMKGLHQSIETASLDQIIRRRVNGKRLLLLAALDLMELIPSIKTEALETILSGVDILRYLNYSSSQETLQSLTLNLACQARYLYNQLIQAEQSPRLLPVSTTTATPMTGNSKDRFDFAKVDSNMQINQSTKQRVSLETLDSVSIIVDQIASVVNWLKSTGPAADLPKFKKDFKSIVLRIAIELTSTAQRDQFVEQPNDVIKKTARFLADYCEWVVVAIDDPDFIQPCWLDIVSVKKKVEEDDYGFVIEPSTMNLLTIEEVIFSSPAHRSGRVSCGDEIIQVDYQTVVGWPAYRVRNLIKTYDSEVIITLRKKPTQSSLNTSVVVMKPYAIPLKRILSHNSECSIHQQDAANVDDQNRINAEYDNVAIEVDSESAPEPPKEPKGPVYELKAPKPRRELQRRVSISGSISDALTDLSLAPNSLPIPVVEKAPPTPSAPEKFRLNRIAKETLTKSVSHDTAKLYLHQLSIDRKHLWLPRSTDEDK